MTETFDLFGSDTKNVTAETACFSVIYSRIERPMIWLFLAIMAVSATFRLATWARDIGQSEDIDRFEGWHIVSAQSCWPGEEKFIGKVDEPPHNVLPYTPGGYLLNSLAGRISGADDYVEYRRAARVLTFIATILAAVLVAGCALTLSVRLWIAVAMAMLVIASGPVQVFAVNPRPDAIANLLNIAGLFVALRFRSIVLAAILFAVAISCKQSYISLTVVMLGWMLINKRWRDAAVFSVTGITTAGLIVWAGYAFLGPYFLEGLPLQSLSAANWKAALYFLGQVLPWCSVPLILGLVYPLVTGARRDPRTMPIFLAFLVSFAINSIALVKPGAFIDYLLEPLTLGAVVAACTWEDLANTLKSAAHRTAVVVICFALVFPFAIRIADSSLEESRSEPVDRSELTRTMRELPGPILSDTAWIYRLGNKPFWNMPGDLTWTTFEQGKLDTEPVRKLIKRHHFSAIVVMPHWEDDNSIPTAWKQQIKESYRLLGVIDGFTVFLPENSSSDSP